MIVRRAAGAAKNVILTVEENNDNEMSSVTGSLTKNGTG